MKRCKTCKYLTSYFGGDVVECENEELVKNIGHRNGSTPFQFEPPSYEFGCTLHEPREQQDDETK